MGVLRRHRPRLRFPLPFLPLIGPRLLDHHHLPVLLPLHHCLSTFPLRDRQLLFHLNGMILDPARYRLPFIYGLLLPHSRPVFLLPISAAPVQASHSLALVLFRFIFTLRRQSFLVLSCILLPSLPLLLLLSLPIPPRTLNRVPLAPQHHSTSSLSFYCRYLISLPAPPRPQAPTHPDAYLCTAILQTFILIYMNTDFVPTNK